MPKTTRLLGRKVLLAVGDLLAVNAVLILLDLERATFVRGAVNEPYLLLWASGATLLGCLLLGMYTDTLRKPASLHLYSAFCASLVVCGSLALAISASGAALHPSKILALG